jgi:2-keto-4-pentenoate hydratase/2-oxohepta-3-ene-1,7-dioic acid hydratase in catechol pathway
MRLVTFTLEGETRLGQLGETEVADLTSLEPGLTDMVDLIAAGPEALADLADRAASAPSHPLASVHLDAPLRPRKNVIAIGRNYLEHVREVPGEDSASRPAPEHPIVFTKPPTSVIGPGEAIDTSNDSTGSTDYEGELAVVIGRTGKRVAAADAWDHVFG